MPHMNISDAYGVLGLSQSASIEEVKSAYKKLALQYHPDKNKATDATEQFQQIGSAYNRILKHLEGPAGGFDPEEWDEGYDSEDELDLNFFMFLFSRSFGRGGGIPMFVPRFSTERTRAEDDARREHYLQEQERLKAERIAAHERQEEARRQWEHQESIRAARLREEKKKTKKEQYTKGKQENEDRVKEAKRDSQKKRSKVFERARSGDAAAVKKGVWEDNVDAAGGEPLAGMENDASFLGQHGGQAGHETLLHIFAKHGDRQTVEWLLDHSADSEERDSFNRTAFHVALQNAHNTVSTLFLSRYPPDEDDSLSTIEPPKLSDGREYSLLRLAMDSISASTVKLVLDNNLFDEKELSDAWVFITSKADSNGSVSWYGPTKEKDERRSKQSASQKKKEWEEIKNMLMTRGGYSQAPPAPTPKSKSTEAPSFQSPKSESGDVPPQENVQSQTGKHAGKGKKNRKGKKGSQIHVDQTTQSTKTSSTTRKEIPLSPPDSKTSLDADFPATNKVSFETETSETTPPTYPRAHIPFMNAYPSPISGYPSPSTSSNRRESLQSNLESHDEANFYPFKQSANGVPHISEEGAFINRSARGNGTSAPDGKRRNGSGRRGRGGRGAYRQAGI